MSGKRGRPPKVREDQWLIEFAANPPEWLSREREALGWNTEPAVFVQAKGWSAAAGENIIRSKRFDPLFPESWWRQCMEYARDQQRGALKDNKGPAKGGAATAKSAEMLRNYIKTTYSDLLNGAHSHARTAELIHIREGKTGRLPSQLRKIVAGLRTGKG